MKQDENYMNQTFGESEITRQIFADMPYPICVKNLSDTQMQVLAQLVEGTLKDKYPDKAEKMFTLWRNGVDDDADMEFLENECVDVEAEWFELLQWYATNCFGAKYYNDPTQEQIDAAIEDIDKKSSEYKEAADMMAETKRRADVVELAEKLWINCYKQYEGYAYSMAFKDAEGFVAMKNKYLKEGKII